MGAARSTNQGSEFEGLLLRTVAEDPGLVDRITDLIVAVWPPFVTDGHPAAACGQIDFMGVYRLWPQLQFGLLDPQDGRLLAGCNATALPYDGAMQDLSDEGFDWALYTATQAHAAGTAPTLMCALGITVDPAAQHRGLGSLAVRAMRHLGEQYGLNRLIAPVRPTWKAQYPLIPMGRYAAWTRADGLPFDPWLRIHARLGGRIVKPCDQAMSLKGSVAEWASWCGLALPDSGNYVLPGLLAPLQVDMGRDLGLYVEPNVWVVHGAV